MAQQQGAQAVAKPDGQAVEPRYTRLSVNLNDEAAEALRTVANHRGVSVTEAVRRAIALLKFVEDESRKGHTLQVADATNGSVRELVLM